MQFVFSVLDSLPLLAWHARVPLDGTGVVMVHHGAGVETSDAGFFEGAWNGEVSDDPLSSATVMCGTGGWLSGDRVQFGGSTDRLCPVFSVRTKDALHFSNSAIFAITAAGKTVDHGYPFFNYDLIKAWRRGLHCPSGKLKLADGSLNIHFATIIQVSKSGEVSFSLYQLGEAPHDYASYHVLLKNSLELLIQNAQAPERKISYQPLAAISKGYDSTASAVLAKEAGCRDAFSFVDHTHENPANDSGKVNAELIGLACQEYSRWSYLERGGEMEVEFSLTPVAVPKTLIALSGKLKGRLMIGAYAGDLIWKASSSRLIHHMAVSWSRYMSGLGQIEFRLREGYFVISAAMIGVRHHLAICDIENSKEMDPWRVGGDYDRPIPRRIAEEVGIPRESFGQVKIGTGHSHSQKEANFSNVAWKDYQEYLNSRSSWEIFSSKAREKALGLWWKVVSQHKKKNVVSTPFIRRFPFFLMNFPMRVSYDYMFTFQWGFERLKKRYRLTDKN